MWGWSRPHYLPTTPVDLSNNPESSGHPPTCNLRKMLEEFYAGNFFSDQGILRNLTVRMSAYQISKPAHIE